MNVSTFKPLLTQGHVEGVGVDGREHSLARGFPSPTFVVMMCVYITCPYSAGQQQHKTAADAAKRQWAVVF
jgi:hypothetical protein